MLSYNVVTVYVYGDEEKIVTRFRRLPSLIYCVRVNEIINAHRTYHEKSRGGWKTIIISGKHDVYYILSLGTSKKIFKTRNDV